MRAVPDSPVTALDEVLLTVIAAHVGKPCPTRREVREWTGLSRYYIWPYLAGMAERGLIEIERRGCRPILRRVRVAGGEWTGWNARGGSRTQ